MKIDFNIINLAVTIVLAVGGFIMTCLWGVLGWLIFRLTGTLDSLQKDVHDLRLHLSAKPDHGFIREEATRISEDGILKHENSLHRGPK